LKHKNPPMLALLLSGGAGTRLWPISRESMPKQFMPLFGEISLYQRTLARLGDAGVSGILVAANQQHEPLLRSQAAAVSKSEPTLLLEPARRDSGPAIAAGVAHALKAHGPDTIIAVMPCDHLIPDHRAFAESLARACQLAERGYLATFGIAPTFPSRDFGYLQVGAAIEGLSDCFHVARFHEKPDLPKAVEYLAGGSFLWNSGMFVFKAGTFGSEAQIHMPDVWSAVTRAVDSAARSGCTIHLEKIAFESAPRISVDFALFERSARVALVRASFAWSDVGTWSSVFDALDKDPSLNAVQGDVRLRDVSNSLVIGDGVRVVAIGMSEFIVVARPEGVFVAPLKRASEIKDMLT
jgi:mannose-1-phosphate guanylyltransferase/mannose-6-phosphate isomerase